jgi:L-iditol 2-dehydrogenase
VAVLGSGPIGLMITKLARLSGADPIYTFDRFPWRVEKAGSWGATGAWAVDEDPVKRVMDLTNGRGVDVVYEAAWGGEAIQQAASMARMGGRVVLVGIPGDNRLDLQHSIPRRKGLTIAVARRMKHTYPRAIHLATAPHYTLDLEDLISHRFPLQDSGHAYAINAAFEEGVHKIMIDVRPERS